MGKSCKFISLKNLNVAAETSSPFFVHHDEPKYQQNIGQ